MGSWQPCRAAPTWSPPYCVPSTSWWQTKWSTLISGKSSEQLIPLAEVTRFRLQKNEMLIRIDDAGKMSHFLIKAMVLRPEGARNQMLEEAEANAMITRHLDPATLREQ